MPSLVDALTENAWVLECVINISEGRDVPKLANMSEACQSALLDVHSDTDHNRSVFTLAGAEVEAAAKALAEAAIGLVDISSHEGVHPRIGVVDVVPFVPLRPTSLDTAVEARNRFARFMAALGVPAFLYGSERTLPEVRKGAFETLDPDYGPSLPHRTAGACAVGARLPLVAYNLWLQNSSIDQARRIARAIRRPGVRSLGLAVGRHVQVSCNLVDPLSVGPAQVFDAVAAWSPIERAELVGLVPDEVLQTQPRSRWAELNLSEEKTIEARLRQRGLR